MATDASSSTMPTSSTSLTRPPSESSPWGFAAEGLVGGPWEPAIKHLSIGKLDGQGRGAEAAAPLPASPWGLAGLAMVLGKQSKDHDALQAAVAALARAGITEALDLAFLGSGDLLPQETVAEVLSDCTVPGAEAALEQMFEIAREGMEGSMTLRTQGLHLAQRAPSEPAAGQAEGLSGSRAERRVRFAADPAPPQKRVRQTRVEDSLTAKLTNEMQKAIDVCFLVLDNLGHSSPRFEKVRQPRKGQEASVVKLQTNAFISNFSSPKGLNTARRRFQSYLLAMKGLSVDPVAPEEWTLAAFIASLAQRGVGSSRKMVQALSWAERAYELNLGLEAPLVQAQRSSWTLGKETPTRRPARTPSVEMVKHMEDLLFNAESNMMRCWAGAQCAMAHGCLRWADLQATKDLKLTKDAVFGTSWRMKGKKTQVPWAALRVGFSGRDWGAAWILELSAANLPGDDFILKAPSSSWTSFSDRIAGFSDCQAAMRALLVKAGMTVQEAMTFSCHSWRHFYPTAGAQLEVHPEAVDKMGHWAPGTGMGALYDGKACVSELLSKNKVLQAVASGWDLSEPGCLPSAQKTMPKKPKQQKSRAASSSQGIPRMMVLQTHKLKIHAYKDGVYTLCRQWKCGTPENPMLNASFTTKLDETYSHMSVCMSCERQQKCSFPSMTTPPKEAEEAGSTSSSSSSSGTSDS